MMTLNHVIKVISRVRVMNINYEINCCNKCNFICYTYKICALIIMIKEDDDDKEGLNPEYF